MSKPRDIVKRISREAKRQNLDFALHREGANHTIYTLDGLKIPIPRHRDVNEMTTEGIYRECEQKLGKGWWRR
ncbi:hypothetical protein [Pseudonocardia kunmingensis]|uniref:HicA-like toxin of HicAB toxin-antitoxin system n=1 Tax=Pseudonocardia kunmingensis TaxID=630975 RepID=A0A543E3T8_9PSEU|nr:hypothetical protein [Pseudonocardia kunmingensis]TQM16268.1 hypothetical protein FB558_3076 [Pseudonocardia kunmingensis]